MAAPAAKLISTVPTAYHSNGFDVVYGTSGATAITSGVVALIRSRYGRYDRLLAESAFRVNVSVPLVLLLLLVLWRSLLSTPYEILASLGVTAFGALLFWQGVTRANQSRDVIVQALVVGVVECRTLHHLPGDPAEAVKASH